VCDIPLSHATSSRQHAALCHHHDGRVFLIDLGSSHGTFLDGSQLPPNKPVVVKNGSSIKFGQAPAKFVMRDVESAGA
jgi:nuclear inhibitor of protein phosphatase 1